MSLEAFNTQFSIFQQEYELFQSGRKVAGTRARNALSALSKQAFILRKQILDDKKSRIPKVMVKGAAVPEVVPEPEVEAAASPTKRVVKKKV